MIKYAPYQLLFLNTWFIAEFFYDQLEEGTPKIYAVDSAQTSI